MKTEMKPWLSKSLAMKVKFLLPRLVASALKKPVVVTHVKSVGETFMPFVDILLKMKMAMKKKAMVLVFYAIFATTYVNPSSIKKNRNQI